MNTKYTILSQLLGSYFHQDWAEEFSDSTRALNEIISCEPADTLKNSLTEIDQLLELKLTEEDYRDIMTSTIGCYFEPSSEKTNYSEWLSKIARQFKEN
ncbi:contact-dependent growth inhibition system immunity protein [Pseudomonas syringae group genomosp. 3]|uniref:contact-dependent growth inhibition system immunity protein n=1 Tax=Pseudomonas syringae group genomosp. 3 TaxID=251701 RepID=UPI000EFE434B|nr:contact-dependent growth inhibition system immunity protein [Pseudomonas syringae group genomosp. 3]